MRRRATSSSGRGVGCRIGRRREHCRHAGNDKTSAHRRLCATLWKSGGCTVQKAKGPAMPALPSRRSVAARDGHRVQLTSPSTTTLTSATTSACGATVTVCSPTVFSGPFGHAHLGLRDLEVDARQRIGDVGVGDRAEQAAVDAGLLRDVNGAAVHLLAQRLRRGELLGGGLLELDAARLELLDRGLGGATRHPGRDQEVAGVAVLDLDDVAEVAEVGDLFQQDDLHGGLLRTCAGRCTAASPGSARA